MALVPVNNGQQFLTFLIKNAATFYKAAQSGSQFGNQVAQMVKKKNNGTTVANGKRKRKDEKKSKKSKRVKSSLKQDDVHRDVTGSGSWSAFYRSGKKKTKLGKMMKLLAQPMYYMLNGSGRLSGNPGSQVVNTPFTLFTDAEIGPMVAQYQAQHPKVTPQPGVTGATCRILLQSVHAKLWFTNQGQNQLYFTVYDLCPKRDIPNGTYCVPDNSWVTGDQDEGYSLSTTTTALANYDSQINTSPLSSNTFRQFWRINKITHGQLGNGDTHSHSVSLKPNRVFESELTTAGTTFHQYKGLSYACMIVVHGAPANDTTTKTQVSSGAPVVDFMYTKSYIFKGVESTLEIVNNVNLLRTSFAIGESTTDKGGNVAGTNVVA